MKKPVILEIRNWTTFLPSERTVLKLLPYILGEAYTDEFLKDISMEFDKPHKFFHPLSMTRGEACDKFISLVDFLYEKGLLRDRQTRSLSSLTGSFLKAVSVISTLSYRELKERWYQVITKSLSDYFKIPNGCCVVIEGYDPWDYLDDVVNDYPYDDGYGAFGDGKSCFVHNPNNGYVWDLIRENDGVVVTVKVFASEKDYKSYIKEGATIESLIDRYKGGARFLLYKGVVLDEKGKEHEIWVAHNAYNVLIPFTPYFWYILLKRYFIENFGKKPFMLGFDGLYSVFYKLDGFLYVNLGTNGAEFIGFVITYDQDVVEMLRTHMDPAAVRNKIVLKEHCPVCNHLTDKLFFIEVEYPEYCTEAVYGNIIIGCESCIYNNMVDYFNSIHEDDLRDEHAYTQFRRITGLRDFDWVYWD